MTVAEKCEGIRIQKSAYLGSIDSPRTAPVLDPFILQLPTRPPPYHSRTRRCHTRLLSASGTLPYLVLNGQRLDRSSPMPLEALAKVGALAK